MWTWSVERVFGVSYPHPIGYPTWNSFPKDLSDVRRIMYPECLTIVRKYIFKFTGRYYFARFPFVSFLRPDRRKQESPPEHWNLVFRPKLFRELSWPHLELGAHWKYINTQLVRVNSESLPPYKYSSVFPLGSWNARFNNRQKHSAVSTTISSSAWYFVNTLSTHWKDSTHSDLERWYRIW